MTLRIIATIGLPGSGKTTWTLQQVEKDIERATARNEPATVCRANRDALRIAHAGRRLGDNRQEAVVSAAQDAMIREAFRFGYQTVIVDDTNLHGTGRLRRLAAELGAVFEVKDFRTVPLGTCILRDTAREGHARVGEKVIREMHDRHVLPWLRERAREQGRNHRTEVPA